MIFRSELIVRGEGRPGLARLHSGESRNIVTVTVFREQARAAAARRPYGQRRTS
jgi:hypothetical protein